MIQSEKAWTFQAVQKRKKPLAIQKDTTATEKQRDIFGEMMEGITAMKAHREGKITLRTLPSRATCSAGGRCRTHTGDPRPAQCLPAGL